MKTHSRPPLFQAVVAPRALSDVNVAISGATAASLFLGRFVFFEYQKKAAAKAGPGMQNGQTHQAAGDRLAAESSVVTSTGDPAGFSIPLLLAWGAIGHALGYFALATNSLTQAGFNAKPF
jgi:photosystem I subunit V